MNPDITKHPRFGSVLRTCRLTVSLTQDELAERSGLSVRAISNMERGRTRPSLRSVRLLADAMVLSDATREQFVNAASSALDAGAAARGRPEAPGGRASRPAVVPRQLPAAIPNFTGRTRELAILDDLLGRAGTKAVVISAIGGTAGVGKTALAVHWAHRVAGRFPDGQLFVNLRGFGPADPATPSAALRGFLDALEVPAGQIPGSFQAQQGLYRSLLADRRVLIVLDNARDAEQVRPLLPGAPDCMVLVSSRRELAGLVAAEGACPLGLDLFTDAEAHDLLARRVGAEPLAAEPAVARELTGLCARLPLALAITAARASARPDFRLAGLAAELRDAHGRLDALATGEQATDVRAVFSWSYHGLPAPAARLFRLIGLHPGPDITAAAAASLAAITPAQARQLLRELARGHLLGEPARGRFAQHDLLRVYAAEVARVEDGGAECRTAAGRVLGHYLHTAHAAAQLIQPQRGTLTLTRPPPGVTPEPLADHHEALAWFRAEHHVLLSAVTLAAELGFDAGAWQLPWCMSTFLDWQGHWDEWAATQRIAVAAVTRQGDQADQATARRALAAACSRLGDCDEAHVHLDDCLAHYRRLGDRAGEARIHQDLCAILDQQDRCADALAHARQSLSLSRLTADRAGQAAARSNLGYLYARLGDYDQALGHCRQAMDLHRELGARYGEAHTWDSLGYVDHRRGHFPEAVASYRHALGLFRELGDRLSEATVLDHLGDAQRAAGDPGAAGEAWRQAGAILDDLHHPDAAKVRAKLDARALARR